MAEPRITLTLEEKVNYLDEYAFHLKAMIDELEKKIEHSQVFTNELQSIILDLAKQANTKSVTKFHSGLFILRLTEHDEMLCAADFNLPTKQVEFTIPEGYLIQEIVLKEKR